MKKIDMCIYSDCYSFFCKKTKTWVSYSDCNKRCDGYMTKKMLNQKKIKEILNG